MISGAGRNPPALPVTIVLPTQAKTATTYADVEIGSACGPPGRAVGDAESGCAG
ncbi:MAG: hypothetical protein ACRDPY_20270 [Streptosporangiaceae bacterium]